MSHLLIQNTVSAAGCWLDASLLRTNRDEILAPSLSHCYQKSVGRVAQPAGVCVPADWHGNVL